MVTCALRAQARAGFDDNDDGVFPRTSRRKSGQRYALPWQQYGAGRLTPTELSPARITEILSAVLHEAVPPEYGPLLSEELGITSRSVALTTPRAGSGFSVGVIGVGMSGIAAARELRASGIRYEVLEKNDGVGGTWYENFYPGCGVDTPSSLYSYSFSPKSDWSRYVAKLDEVSDYFEKAAEQARILENITFGVEVESAVWDGERRSWTVTARTRAGERIVRTYSVLISAVGQVNRPNIPAIEGADAFGGNRGPHRGVGSECRRNRQEGGGDRNRCKCHAARTGDRPVSPATSPSSSDRNTGYCLIPTTSARSVTKYSLPTT